MKYLHITFVLNYGEFRKNLIAAFHVIMLIDPDMKTAFTVHKTCNPCCVKFHQSTPNVKSLGVPGSDRAFPADCPHVRWIFTAGIAANEYQTVFEDFPANCSVLLRLAFINLRTVIVTAAVYWGFSSMPRARRR